MTTTTPLPEVATYAKVVTDNIREDFTADELAEVGSFSDLHDLCDANTYLALDGPLGDQVWSLPMDDRYAYLNRVIDTVEHEMGWSL